MGGVAFGVASAGGGTFVELDEARVTFEIAWPWRTRALRRDGNDLRAVCRGALQLAMSCSAAAPTRWTPSTRRTVAGGFAPFAASTRAPSPAAGSMPFRETDALGQRVQRKGTTCDVHLLEDW